MQLSMWAREGLLTDPRETHCSKGFFDQIGQAPVKKGGHFASYDSLHTGFLHGQFASYDESRDSYIKCPLDVQSTSRPTTSYVIFT